MYVQYGCGHNAPKEWSNFDASFTLKWERLPLVGQLCTKNRNRFPDNVQIGDIVTGLPVRARSCLGVYASHVLEHLALDDFHRALDNTEKLLRRDGIFRVVVPDLEWIAREYISRLTAGDASANAFFLKQSCLGRASRPRGLRGIVDGWLRTSSHNWMWDFASLARVLEEHKFHSIRRCSPGDCEDPLFALVEDEGHFGNAVAIEARSYGYQAVSSRRSSAALEQRSLAVSAGAR